MVMVLVMLVLVDGCDAGDPIRSSFVRCARHALTAIWATALEMSDAVEEEGGVCVCVKRRGVCVCVCERRGGSVSLSVILRLRFILGVNA